MFGKPGKERGHFCLVSSIFCRELLANVPFLAPSEAVIGEDQDGPHEQRDERRPLDQQAQSDEKQSVILWMPDTSVNPLGYEPLALAVIYQRPAFVEEVKTESDDAIADQVQNHHRRAGI